MQPPSSFPAFPWRAPFVAETAVRRPPIVPDCVGRRVRWRVGGGLTFADCGRLHDACPFRHPKHGERAHDGDSRRIGDARGVAHSGGYGHAGAHLDARTGAHRDACAAHGGSSSAASSNGDTAASPSASTADVHTGTGAGGTAVSVRHHAEPEVCSHHAGGAGRGAGNVDDEQPGQCRASQHLCDRTGGD